VSPFLTTPMIDRLADLVMARTGFRTDAVNRNALSRAVEDLLGPAGDPEAFLRRAEADDPSAVGMLVGRSVVGETYFFRHPEHFDLMARQVIPRLIAGGATRIRAWSAGCATGEEAYSLAACLFACAGHLQVEVLGTDILPEHLATAERAIYGSWSMRGLPQLFPLLESAGTGRATIRPEIRRLVRFARHNLLDSPVLLGPFDVVFCRNVLVYFDDQRAAQAVDHLASALAPEGTLFFSAMDCRSAPTDLVHAGTADLAIFHRPAEGEAPPPPRPPPRRATRVSPPPAIRPAPPAAPAARAAPREPPHVKLHLRALVALEAGDGRSAERLLGELADLAPDYVPGLLERALFLARQGRAQAAARLMRELLTQVDTRDAQEPVEGPEILPVAYYRATATAFLRAAQGEGAR
jgi:chemotaxis protein methyltransferase CheR